MRIFKKRILLIIFFPAFLHAQKGIVFEHKLTWTEILAKAKSENKYIFVDAFTTWCGPCRYMSNKVFANDKVGEFYNNRFVCLKLQMDTTTKDDVEIKNRYATAHEFGERYNINAYPTLLYFNSDGEIVHKLVGSTEPEAFVEKSVAALQPENQFYYLLNQYNKGNLESKLLRSLVNAAEEAYEPAIAARVSNEYLNTQKEYGLNDENIDFIIRHTRTISDAGFKLLLQHENEINKKMHNTGATNKINEIITDNELNKLSKRNPKDGIDWKLIRSGLQKKFPKHADYVTLKCMVIYYKNKEEWTKFGQYVQQLMSKYGQSTTAEELNNYAWTVFENISDKTILKKAVEWSKQSLESNEDISCIDTYANLLYKTGNQKEAIIWEEKAIEKANEDEKEVFISTIEKMKKGEKTWIK